MSNPAENRNIRGNTIKPAVVESDSVSTEELTNVSDGDRPVFDGNGNVTVNVPNDFPTIQEAIDASRFINSERYQVNIEDGDYSDEDIYIPPTHASAIHQDTKTEGRFVRIVGNTSSPSDVSIGSVCIDTCIGLVDVIGVEVSNESPFGNENAGIIAYHTNEVLIDSVSFASDGTWDNTSQGSRAIEAYASNINVKTVDLGPGLVAEGFISKRESIMDVSGVTTGYPTDKAFRPLTGICLFHGDDCESLESANSLVDGSGYATDIMNDIQYLPTSFDHAINDGSSTVTRWWNKGNNTRWGEIVQITTGVSTSAVSVLNNDQTDIKGRGGLVVVHGTDHSDDTVAFTDLVMFVAFGSVTEISSASRGTPSSRSYSVSGHNLELTMGADTYNVGAMWTGGTII